MGRTPCCDKARVKRGPWTQAEDLRLVSFIHKYGHDNWRALPKQAGLLRCGKSCRLRWINYLRPDVKRGNFTLEEEEAIIKLHDLLGNKWSKIASELPGRTDNEIKNVWHTHLKKRLIAKGHNSSSIEVIESMNNHHQSSSSSLSNEYQGTSVPNNLPGSFLCNENEQKVLNQTSPPDETLEPSSYNSSKTLEPSSSNSSNSYTSQDTHMKEQVPSVFGCENICDISVVEEYKLNTHDVYEEIIEIPFEPNLDLWNMLDIVEPNGDSEVPVGEVQGHDQDISISKEDKREGESWWWLAYLENELGLEATMFGSQENLTIKGAVEPPVPNFMTEELLSEAKSDKVGTCFQIWPSSPQTLGL